MNTEQFLTAVLPSQGNRFGLVTFGKQGDDDFRPAQRHFPPGDVTDIVGYTAWGSRQGGNAYFAVAGFALVVNAEGKARRTAEAAQWHRCLRLDIDVGADKPYAEKRDALVQLMLLIQRFAMPKPWIVDSGGGIHAYWAFDRDVVLNDWVHLAARLRAGCEAFGLMCDHTTTIDAARVLRMPGTMNNKPGMLQRPVRLLQAGDAADPAVVVQLMPQPTHTVVNMAVPVALRHTQSELQANLHQPYFMRDAIVQCPGLSAMVADKGARAQEPLWKAALDLINKSGDTDAGKLDLARHISVGHPGFTEESFQRKWQQVREQDYHPPTCSRMAAAGMPECARCPLNGKISSPLVLGRPRLQAPPSDAAIPPPPPPVPQADPPAAVPPPPGAALVVAPSIRIGVFEIGSSSSVRVVDGRLTAKLSIVDGFPTQLVEVEDANGQKKAYNRNMLDYRLLHVERMLDGINKRSAIVLTFERAKDGNAAIEFDNNDFAEPKRFYNRMHAEGLYCSRKSVADFLEKFMPEFLSQLQRARAASQIAGRCGWTDDRNAFVLGTTIYRRDGSEEAIRTAVAPGEMEGYHATGDEAQWRAAFEIALAGGLDRQAVIALALAGPLMVFTGLDGVMVNAYSPESGVGKSTLCDAALSIWGSPNALRKDFRDTSNATFKLASVSGNMPMVVDEFTNVEGKALSDYVYTITQGREKHRLSSDARLNQNSSRWCLAAIATSNNSVHDKLQAFRADSTAEAARVFELRLHPLNVDNSQLGRAKEILNQLRFSYGFLGPKVIRLFLAQPEEYWRQQVMKRIAKWDAQSAAGAGDRFRSACCALMEIGAALGKALGFDFDPLGVERELARHWTKQVAEFEAERKSPLDYVKAYALEYISEFAMIGGLKGDQLMNPSAVRKYRGEIRGSTVTGSFKPTTVMIPMDPLREFVRERHGSYKSLVEWIHSSPLVTRHGQLTFLENTSLGMSIAAVEFKHESVMGHARALSIVPTPSAHEGTA